MDPISAMEECRVGLQSELDSAKTQKERNQLGQFATPTGLATHFLGMWALLKQPLIQKLSLLRQ